MKRLIGLGIALALLRRDAGHGRARAGKAGHQRDARAQHDAGPQLSMSATSMRRG